MIRERAGRDRRGALAHIVCAHVVRDRAIRPRSAGGNDFVTHGRRHHDERTTTRMSTDGIRLYDPTAEPRGVAARLAPRLGSLAGTRVGILDNGKANAGTLMLAVTRILQERYGVTEVVKREKPVAGPPRPEVLEALSECDFALVGSAD
jgi:hypothetical protein